MEETTDDLAVSVESEQKLLGSLLVYPELIDRVSGNLSERDFYDPLHQRMFAAINKLNADGTKVSPITLNVAMRDDAGLKELGGHKYLAALCWAAPAMPVALSLVKPIKEFQSRRALKLIANELFSDSTSSEFTVQELIEKTEGCLYRVAEKSTYGDRQVSFSEAIKLATDEATRAQDSGGKITGLSTGLTDLDNLLGGLQPSDLIILAARPAMGKSALAGNIAFHAASNSHPVQFFSLEMSTSQVSNRILSDQTGIELWRIRNGQMRPEEWEDYLLTGRKLDSYPLYIDDTGGLTLAQLASRARRAKRENKIELIVIDYLQLMSGTRKDGNRVQEITEITKGLKSLAKELQVPILALSQLSRGVDSRDDKRPVLSDLRESGSIEQDADVVIFVFRQEYYTASREPDISDVEAYGKWQKSMERCHGRADLLVEKHRHGATNVVHVAFDAKFTRFKNLE